MYIVSAPEAMQHLGITHNHEEMMINNFLLAAQGIIEQEIEKDIYLKQADVPEGRTNVLIYELLTPSKQASLQVAIKLVLSTLYLYRDSTTDLKLSENPAFSSCIKGFNEVYIG